MITNLYGNAKKIDLEFDMNLLRVFQIGNSRVMKVGYLKCMILC